MDLLKLRLSIIGTLALIIGLSTLAFTVLLTLTGTFNIYFMIILVVFINLLQWIFSPRLIDSLYKVKEVSSNEQPKLHNMMDKICQKSSLIKPKVMLANISLPNAFAYGSPRYGNRIAVTTGLLESLEDEEVEAVLAHEVGHLKNRDVQVMMFASVLPAIFYYIGFSFMLSSWFGGGRRDNGGTIVIGIAAMAIYWVLSIFVLSLSRIREYYADRHAINTVDDGARKLSEALVKIATSENKNFRKNQKGGSSSFKSLFINDPDTAKNDTESVSYFKKHLSDRELVDKMLSKKITGLERVMELFSTHPNMVKRLKAIQKMQ